MNAHFWLTGSVVVLVLYLVYYHIRNKELLLGPVPEHPVDRLKYWLYTFKFLILAAALLCLFAYGLWNLYWYGEFKS
jgi:hypothetical protein